MNLFQAKLGIYTITVFLLFLKIYPYLKVQSTALSKCLLTRETLTLRCKDNSKDVPLQRKVSIGLKQIYWKSSKTCIRRKLRNIQDKAACSVFSSSECDSAIYGSLTEMRPDPAWRCKVLKRMGLNAEGRMQEVTRHFSNDCFSKSVFVSAF